LVGPNALWPTQPKFWEGHGPPGPRCSAPTLWSDPVPACVWSIGLSFCTMVVLGECYSIKQVRSLAHSSIDRSARRQ